MAKEKSLPYESLRKPKITSEDLKAKGLSTNGKSVRARARRAAMRSERIDAELGLIMKPVEEWDEEELARGLPREKWGVTGYANMRAWLPQAVHEEVISQYQKVVKGKMNEATLPAVRILAHLMEDERVDVKGKPLVPASVKLNAAQFLIEHVVGKPTVRVEADISVKLQGLLAHVMAVPGQQGLVAQGFEGWAASPDDPPPIELSAQDIIQSSHAVEDDDNEDEDEDEDDD